MHHPFVDLARRFLIIVGYVSGVKLGLTVEGRAGASSHVDVLFQFVVFCVILLPHLQWVKTGELRNLSLHDRQAIDSCFRVDK